MTKTAINRYKAESVLAKVINAQHKFWDAMNDLEAQLGVDVDSSIDFDNTSIEELLGEVE